MSTQQYRQEFPQRKEKVAQSRFFQGSTKEEEFYAHFSKLHNSRANSDKNTQISLASDYHSTFERYNETSSLMDRIRDSFDNGKITDLFNPTCQFVHSLVYLQFPPQIKHSVLEVNRFFGSEPPCSDVHFDEPFTHLSYAIALSEIKNAASVIQEVEIVPQSHREQVKKTNARSETVATLNAVDSKVDLLLNQINFQKKRREDCPFYIQAMEIKLNEFLDYILGEEERFIGFSLQDKASELVKELHLYKGKKMQGWLVLVLLQIFFEEFKELQTYKVERLREQRRKHQEKQEVHSQADAKSVKSSNSSMRKGKYSEPNSRRNTIQEQQWIGALK